MMQLWKKVFPIFKDTRIQSPSKRILDEIFEEMDCEKIISLNKTHLIGEKIIYKSIDETLEIFLNFHAESFFNERKDIDKIIQLLKRYFLKFQRKDGKIAIQPGCFVYTLTKL